MDQSPKEQIMDVARGVVRGNTYANQEDAMLMALLFLEVLIDIRDNLKKHDN